MAVRKSWKIYNVIKKHPVTGCFFAWKGKDAEEKNVQQAVILAGGYGKCLAPFTEHDPKPNR